MSIHRLLGRHVGRLHTEVGTVQVTHGGGGVVRGVVYLLEFHLQATHLSDVVLRRWRHKSGAQWKSVGDRKHRFRV